MTTLSLLQSEFDKLSSIVEQVAPKDSITVSVLPEYVPSKPVPKKKSKDLFRLPVGISDQLCDFLEIPRGTKIPRTDVTKRLCTWVNLMGVKNCLDKRCIDINSPNAAPLKAIMSPISHQDQRKFTCFTMQKYIQHHYLK